MKRKSIVLLTILVLAIAICCWYFISKRSSGQISFVTAQAQYGSIQNGVTATGNMEPVDTVSVGAQVSGVVVKLFANNNDAVKKGQLLAQVDASIYSAQVDEAKANLASAQSNLEYQKNTFERQSELYRLGAISKADYQLALNQYNAAQATVANANAQLVLAKKTLGYTDIYSPVNGIVLLRNISVGQTIASSFNAPVLFIIAKDLTKMQVNANVDEADIGGVKVGQHVTFSVDAFPDEIFGGTVTEILYHATMSANVVTYPTLVNVDNNDLRLRPGMTASITIITQRDSNALLIPSRALSFKPDSSLFKKYAVVRAVRDTSSLQGKGAPAMGTEGQFQAQRPRTSYVWARRGDSLVEKQILTGMNDDAHVEVLGGLSAAEEVIIGVAKANSNKKMDNAQSSPFMPQMRPKPPGGTNKQ